MVTIRRTNPDGSVTTIGKSSTTTTPAPKATTSASVSLKPAVSQHYSNNTGVSSNSSLKSSTSSTPTYNSSSSSSSSYSTPSYSSSSSSSPSYSSSSSSSSSSPGTVQIKNPNTGSYMTVTAGSQIHQNYLKNNPSAIATASTKDTASFSLNNLSGNSGVLLNGLPSTHQQALSNNPLHAVNGNRQSLIQNAVKSGDWTSYNNFEASQNPLAYDKDASGNYTQNKQYYADLITSSYNAMIEAQQKGDAAAAATWQSSLQDRINSYNNAPGMAVYIPRLHDSGHGQGNMYGIMDYDQNFSDSVYNMGGQGYINNYDKVAQVTNATYDNNDYLQQWLINNYADDGMLGQDWARNAVFQNNPELLNAALSASNSYGSQGEQALRQQINAQGLSQLSAPTDYAAQNRAMEEMYMQMMAEEQAKQQALQLQLQQLQEQQAYQQSELSQLPIGTTPTTPIAPVVTTPSTPTEKPTNHVYAPGTSANQSGYTENQLITNETFYKYLQDIYKGGF